MYPAIQRLSAANKNALDDPIWSALTTRHERVAVGTQFVRRYPADVSQFAAFSGDILEHKDVLRILASDGPVSIVTAVPMKPIVGLQVHLHAPVEQMIASTSSLFSKTALVQVLDEYDVPEMLALAALTRPGPFLPKTNELGKYVGIRDGNRLVAMAGERIRFDRFTEISATCVHPSYRGQGLAKSLVSALMDEILQRGEMPIVHPLQSDRSAVALYRRLGFERRRQLHITRLHHWARLGLEA
jgi:predicted GNAT family acetyltransferase